MSLPSVSRYSSYRYHAPLSLLRHGKRHNACWAGTGRSRGSPRRGNTALLAGWRGLDDWRGEGVWLVDEFVRPWSERAFFAVTTFCLVPHYCLLCWLWERHTESQRGSITRTAKLWTITSTALWNARILRLVIPPKPHLSGRKAHEPAAANVLFLRWPMRRGRT